MKVDIMKIIIIIGIGIILYLLLFDKPQPSTNSTTTTIIVKDTTIDTVIQTNLKPTYITNNNTVTTLPTDTNFIKQLLNDYFATKAYNDTVRNDSSMMVIINDTVSKNEIKFRSVFTKNNRPTLIQTTTTNNYYSDNGLFVTGGLRTATNTTSSLILGAGYKFKNNQIGLNLGLDKSIELTYSYGFYKYKK